MKKLSSILLSMVLAVSVMGFSSAASAHCCGYTHGYTTGYTTKVYYKTYYKWVNTPCGCKRVACCKKVTCCVPVKRCCYVLPVEKPCCRLF